MVQHRTEKAYFVGTHPNSYRMGEAAEILGVVTFIPAAGKDLTRPCFHVRYLDGKEDYTPVSDRDNYKIVCQSDLALFVKEN